MKNFSAKTANFQNLKVKDANVISEVNLGTAPNQIPLNKDLGSLAYQDAVNLDDVSADMVELRAIAAEISDSAVDVFVYDTSRDSDGGKWRERTQHTSWYNEELNTSTRGARREFPAVAVIVAEADKVTIYDGDDPDLGMWMVFDVTDNMNLITISTVSSVTALNGVVSVGCNGTTPHFTPIDFISEKSGHYTTAGNKYFLFDISKRNNTSEPAHGSYDGTIAIVSSVINDVAMTVLPNAPIDENTGLPVPTIAVATDGGVSVIKDDGTVVDITGDSGYNISESVSFQGEYLIYNHGSNAGNMYFIDRVSIPSSDVSWTNVAASETNKIAGAGAMKIWGTKLLTLTEALLDDAKILTPMKFPQVGNGNTVGASIIDSDWVNRADGTDETGMIVNITSKYNTGWMPGDIKLAALSDSIVETIGTDSSELVTNGDFSIDVTGWSSTSGASISHDTTEYAGGALQINQNSSSGQGAYQSINTIIGQSYVLNVIGKGDSIGNLSNLVVEIGTSIMGSELAGQIVGSGSVEGNVSITFVASSTITYISLGPTGSDTRVAYVDNISVRATTELITNGDFSNGDDGSWNIGNESTATFANDQLTITGTRVGGPFVKQDLFATGGFSGLVEGRTYTIDVDVESITSGIFRAYVGPSTNSTESITTAGRYSHTFVHNSSYSAVLYLQGSANQTVVVNSISVRPAEEDRSVNGNGLQIVGEIQKTPVAPGADLVAYSGFSADDYLMQPYNSDLDFGTGDFCVMGWARSSGASQAYISVGPESGTGARIISGVDSGNRWFFTAYDNTDSNTTRYLSRNLSTYSTGYDWVHIVAGRKDGVFFFYFNNKEMPDENNTATDSKDLTNTNSTEVELKIGVNWQKTAGGGELALVRISKTAPTPEQIAKIYRDEKVLFQDGAQATLYGTSDAVTALAYDEKTKLLHVGTSSGRSDFSGLRRINNTTTAITTSISAHNNLIAEQ